MKYLLLIIIFSGFALNAFAQRDEKLRFLITDSEQTDSAYLKFIVRQIFYSTKAGKIKVYQDSVLKNEIVVENIEKLINYCEKFEIPIGDGDDPFKDTIICSSVNPQVITTFSILNKNYSTLPLSISLDLDTAIPS